MSAPSDTMTDSPFDRAAPPRPAPHAVRPFFWSVRRELWENQAIWIAPLAVAALVIFGSLVSAVGAHHMKSVHRTPVAASQAAQTEAAQAGAPSTGTPPSGDTTTLSQSSPGGSVTVSKVIKVQGPPPTPEQRRALAAFPFYMVTAAMILTMFLVAVFYCLGGMFNERRDRSILFWKSLPVRDVTTVASKIVLPMAILPVVTLVVALAAEGLMYTIGVLAFAAHAPAEDASVPIGDVVTVLVYCLAVQTLWWAPLYAWLLLVSGWAKRAPFLWAVLPPLGLAIAEKLAFGTTAIGRLIQSRVFGGFEAAFVTPKRPQPGTNPMAAFTPHIDAPKFVSSPGLWLGLLVAVGLLAATVWMRRRREPI